MAFAARAFYRGLASHLRAGTVPDRAVAALRANGTLPPEAGDRIAARLSAGDGVARALEDFPELFEPEDVALVDAGERTGRLDETLDRLAQLHDDRREAWRELVQQSLYPIVLVHFAAALVPIGLLASRGRFTVGGWFLGVLLILGPPWAAILLAWRVRRRPDWRARFRRWIDRLPAFGHAARLTRRARFARTLEASYEAAVPLSDGIGLAGRAAGRPDDARRAAEVVAGGEPLWKGLQGTGLLTGEQLRDVETAESAGELGPALRRIAGEEDRRARDAMRLAFAGLAKAIYIAVVIGIAVYALVMIGRVYSGYVSL